MFEAPPVIFGCTADPFTPAHFEMVRGFIEQHVKVCVIPTVVTYHREGKTPWLCDSDRKYVIEALLGTLGDNLRPYWSVWDKELEIRQVCEYAEDEDLTAEVVGARRFVHTLIDYTASTGLRFPSILLGTDSFANFKTWYRWKDILKLAGKILVVPGRDGASLPEVLSQDENLMARTTMMPALEKPFCDMSATRIRESYRFWGGCQEDYVYDFINWRNGHIPLESLGWI